MFTWIQFTCLFKHILMTPKQCCICKKYVNKHTSLTCIICSCVYHTKYLPYLQINDVELITNWHCIKCISSILPFNHLKNDYDFLNSMPSLMTGLMLRIYRFVIYKISYLILLILIIIAIICLCTIMIRIYNILITCTQPYKITLNISV